MNIIIQSLGFTAGESLEAFIQKKINGLNADRIIRANVTLYKEEAWDETSNYCEIRLEVPGNDLLVKKHSAHFETSVSECVEVLSHMLHKSRDKETQRRVDATVIQNALMASDRDELDSALEDDIK